MRGFFPASETPPGYEALRAFWAARRAHLPLQMRPKEVGDAACPQLAASDRLALRSRERSAQPGLLASDPRGRVLSIGLPA
jgi:hypothetical protein